MENYENQWIDLAWESINQKVKKTSLIIGSQFPSMTESGIYTYTTDYWRWVTGFWPGLLWLLYEENKYEPFKDIAVACEDKMDEALYEYTNLHHDVGFMWLLTSVKRYKLSGNMESKKRGLIAASHLASRFNIKGNYLRAWNKNGLNEANSLGLSIIDSMMNLPLLYWASEELGDPRFSHIAKAHSDTVLKEFIREDGSVNHMVEFDPYTGEKIKVLSGQGYSTTSAWSRGASWALHGMALAYKYTKEQKYLDCAKKVANFFISQLPEDNVPHWDFRAPRTETIPRDTSAGACAACGLLELSGLVSEEEKHIYEKPARDIVKSLYDNYGNWSKDDEEGLLSGGTFNCPANLGIDISLIYGDYYFVEAISRLKKV
ncbi:glycoside hydrolase family 88 protein [Clostridium grantii]|uniref:Unsaturated chondroitin disaccharide hydrolase n=1 Tax=Clostridium grantii DSM 8605 TaxID=1121316 RepID=A0A1M5SVL2_9CLOT|nr:glycoside hydrolase family 88 protein [Clostridium grantii]SHH42601.1 unsaturated chondroitin disaccharide hydrolase [Clostridium grantii DSM 8605]